MKKKANRKNKNKVARLRRQTVLRKPMRKKTVARKRKPTRKAVVEPKELGSNAGALRSLPEVTDADREAIVDVIEVFEVGVLNTEANADEAEVVPEETEEEVV